MNRKLLKVLTLAGIVSFAGITPALAGVVSSDVETLKQQVAELMAQNKKLTSRMSELENEPQHVETPPISENKLENTISKYVSFSGAIEVEASIGEDFDNTKNSDITLATVELGFDSQVTDWASGHVLALYEEGEDFTIDEAFITLGNVEKLPMYFAAGRMYVPFGNFESNMISDPLTLEIAETQETALQIGFEIAGLYGSVFAFNGDTNKAGGDSQIEQFGANIGYALEQDGFAFDIGASYINSMGDTDGMSGILEEQSLLEADYVDGIGAYAIVAIGPISVIGEYITALDDFDDTHDNQPMAFNVETGYTFEISGMESTIAVAYQGTDDMAGFLPESRILTSLGISIFEGTTFAIEYAYDEDYDISESGTDESAYSFTAQLAYEF